MDVARPYRSPRSLREAWLALSGLTAVFLFEMLDNSILNVALPTIGRELGASLSVLQWITAAYSVTFGGLMLVFGALSDRVGRRRIMLAGLVLLAVASLATATVATPAELLAVRAVMGVAAAMTTPGSMALAFRLFAEDSLRVRAMTLISTVGLIGLAVGPTAGGFVLAIAPWQTLLLVNVPVATLAFAGIAVGIAPDDRADLHPHPVDITGAALGTATIVLALVAPSAFVQIGAGSWEPWAAVAAAGCAAVGFVLRERSAAFPLLDLALLSHPLVSSGLAFRSAAGLATAGLGYLVTLQLQLQWGWTPAQAALGLLPQVVVLLAGGALIRPLMDRIGLERAAWLSSSAVVAGLAVFAALGRQGYAWVAGALALVAAGMRVVGVVAGTNVLRGLPPSRTTIGAALVDTASEVTSGAGVALAGTILAALVTRSLVSEQSDVQEAAAFGNAVTVAAVALTVAAGALVATGILRSRRGTTARDPEPAD